MPLTIRLVDPDTQEDRPLRIRDFEELTVADWKALTPINEATLGEDESLDAQLAKAAYFTGIPVETWYTWPIRQATLVLDHVNREMADAFKGSAAFQKALAEGTDFVSPEFIEVAGKKYRVPNDLETETTLGQYVDWAGWDAPEHEADLIAEACAFMLVEEGQSYQGTPKEKIEAMQQMPIQTGWDLCAFFFTRSVEFQNVTKRRFRKFSTSMQLLLTTTLRLSTSVIEGSASSGKPQS